MARDSEKKDRPNARFRGRVEGTGGRARIRAARCRANSAPPEEGPANGFEGPRPYRWFCLDHVREFNARYNFFQGMSPDEIHDAQRLFRLGARGRALPPPVPTALLRRPGLTSPTRSTRSARASNARWPKRARTAALVGQRPPLAEDTRPAHRRRPPRPAPALCRTRPPLSPRPQWRRPKP